MTKKTSESEESIWGSGPEEREEKKREPWMPSGKVGVGVKTAWRLKDVPTLENIHPEDIIERCTYCGEDRNDGCDCYCEDCGELRDDCSWCSDCESHDCSC